MHLRLRQGEPVLLHALLPCFTKWPVEASMYPQGLTDPEPV